MDDILRMAREAGFETALMKGQILTKFPLANVTKEVERFAELVRADEREACARVCEAEASRAKWNWDNDISGNQPFWNGGEQLASSCAAAIRARGQA